MQEKYCPKCDTTRSLSDFYKNAARHDGYQSYCKKCIIQANAKSAKKRYRTRKKQGLCLCGKKLWQNKSACEKCYMNSIKNHEKNAHKPCTACGGYPRAKASSQCKPCIRKRDHDQKVRVFEAYGGTICACCGETELAFLSLDHVEQNGAEHRKEVGLRVYRYLEKEGYPDPHLYQVLCRNCNWGRWVNNGICPHQDNK